MGSGNLHNKSPVLRWRRHRGNSSSDADKSLHASGVKELGGSAPARFLRPVVRRSRARTVFGAGEQPRAFSSGG